jgi:mycothiol system anti-sigma-R factor
VKSDVSDGGECRTFRDSIYHYLDNELHESERSRLQQHLDGCPGCGRYLEFEDRFSGSLRARLPRLGAPEGLLDRVTSALDREGASRRRRSRVRTYVGAAGFMAAAGVLVALGLPGRWFGSSAGSPPVHVVREVTVVDEECDRAGISAERQRGCKKADHLNALKLKDGSYWNLSLDGPEARHIAAEPLDRGRRLVVEGDLYTPIRTLHVTHVRDPGGGSL